MRRRTTFFHLSQRKAGRRRGIENTMQHSAKFADAEGSAEGLVGPIRRLAVDQGELVRFFLLKVAKLDGERIRRRPVDKARPAQRAGVPMDHFRTHEIRQGMAIVEGGFAAPLENGRSVGFGRPLRQRQRRPSEQADYRRLQESGPTICERIPEAIH